MQQKELPAAAWRARERAQLQASDEHADPSLREDQDPEEARIVPPPRGEDAAAPGDFACTDRVRGQEQREQGEDEQEVLQHSGLCEYVRLQGLAFDMSRVME